MVTLFRSLLGTVGAFFCRSKLERRLQDELQLHIDLLTQENIRLGMAHDEAQRQARIAVGGFEQTREVVRDARGFGVFEDIGRDFRYGVRSLRRSPAFTVAAIITLALGIGANTAIFTVVNAVLLRPLPFRNADRLITIWEKNLGPEWAGIRALQPGRKDLISTSVPVLREWQAHFRACFMEFARPTPSRLPQFRCCCLSCH